MSENIGLIIGGLLFLTVIFGGAFLEFLDRRRQQRFAHEQEMARIATNAKMRDEWMSRQTALAKDDGQAGDDE